MFKFVPAAICQRILPALKSRHPFPNTLPILIFFKSQSWSTFEQRKDTFSLFLGASNGLLGEREKITTAGFMQLGTNLGEKLGSK